MKHNRVLLKDYNSVSSEQKQSKRRIDYLYGSFALDKQSVTVASFIDLINKYYYKYAADEYSFPWDLRSYYSDVLSQLEPGFDIVDIGAGTGFSYNLIRSIGYNYGHYYFVEPSKNMSDRLKSDDTKLVIVNDYIENCWSDLKSNGSKKLFVMNAAFHHIIDLDKFAYDLRDSMSDSDVFFIPYEPNNGYNNSPLAILFNAIRILKDPKGLAIGLAGKLRLVNALQNLKRFVKKLLGKSSNSETYYLTKALNELVANKIVSPQFTEQMIYAITDYGVFDNWKNISMPDEFNEGFYNLENINRILGLQIMYSKTYTFQHPEEFNAYKFRQFIDKKMRGIFPRSGALICMAFKK